MKYKYKDPQTKEESILDESQNIFFDLLVSCIKDEDSQLVESVLQEYAFLVYVSDDDGFTALRFASHPMHHNQLGLAVVKILMRYGSDPYAENNKGFTPIDDIDDITDPNLKAEFCAAMGISTDTTAILDDILDKKAEKMAIEQVEARYAAKEAAEAARKAALDAEIDRDPMGAVNKLLYSDTAGKNTQAVMNKLKTNNSQKKETCIISTAFTEDAMETKEAKEALEVKKSDQLEFPVDEGLSVILEKMFGSKKNSLDDLIGSKEAFALEVGNKGFFSSFGSVLEYLSNQLSALLEVEVDENLVEATILQLQFLLHLAGSGPMPIGIPHRHDDDFEPGSGGSNSGVIFENNPYIPQNSYFVTILGNGTIVIAEDQRDI